MKLEKLLKEVEYEFIQGSLGQNVNQIDYDSRNVTKDSLFVCIKGSRVDGHQFIDQVIERGAKTIVIEDDVQYRKGITYMQD